MKLSLIFILIHKNGIRKVLRHRPLDPRSWSGKPYENCSPMQQGHHLRNAAKIGPGIIFKVFLYIYQSSINFFLLSLGLWTPDVCCANSSCGSWILSRPLNLFRTFRLESNREQVLEEFRGLPGGKTVDAAVVHQVLHKQPINYVFVQFDQSSQLWKFVPTWSRPLGATERRTFFSMEGQSSPGKTPRAGRLTRVLMLWGSSQIFSMDGWL